MDTQICSENNSHSFPQVMGILNVTPDSFSDGGVYNSVDQALKHSAQMIKHGADIIDIGGESSRPFSEPVSLNEELKRVLPVIESVRKEFPSILISIDTYKFNVAKAAIDYGADIINDITGLQHEPGLAELAAANNKGLVIMHMKGNPSNMQANPEYTDVVSEVKEFLIDGSEFAANKGVEDIIIDPGIGFGKSPKHNIELIKHLDEFCLKGSRLLLGISRKSFLGKLLKIEEPSQRDISTALLHALLLRHKIDIIRVHNVEFINQLKLIHQTFS